jgi:formate dehydrogenase subunit gamma
VAVDDRVLRFDGVQRAAHWATAVLVLCLLVTGALLYVPSLGALVGHRLIVEDVHVFVGVAVFVPVIAAVSGHWGRRLRRDLAAMNRFTAGEVDWLRTVGHRGRDAVGKYNPGQKLNTFAIGALLTVQLVTGLILRWGTSLAVSVRTGATFVHDWAFIALLVLIAGHIAMAVTHPAALRSMVRGWVRRDWVAHHAPAWPLVEERTGSPDAR